MTEDHASKTWFVGSLTLDQGAQIHFLGSCVKIVRLQEAGVENTIGSENRTKQIVSKSKLKHFIRQGL